MLAVPELTLGVGVNWAVKIRGSMLFTTKPDNVPPLVVMSLASKPTGTSEKVKVKVALWPTRRLELLLLIVKLGALVSATVVL